MNRKNARKVALLMVMCLLPLYTTGCGGLLGGIVGGAGRLIGGAGRLIGRGVLGAGRLVGAGVGALIGGGNQVRNDGPLQGTVNDALPGSGR